MTTILLLLILTIFTVHGDVDRVQRILVNDQDFLNNELQTLKTTIQALSNKVTQQENEITQLKSTQNNVHQDNHGAIYIRWGRNQCSDNESDIVYSGYAGGSHYNAPGGSGEYKCLPSDPIYAIKDPVIDLTWSAYMYGSEYETHFAPDSHDEDVPCAVCMSKLRGHQLMIAGRNQCYPGWKKEYSGFLASNSNQLAAAGQYICVDEHPEYVPAGQSNQAGMYLYFVLSVCGPLPCPPYKNNRPLTCVVCSI